MKPLRAITFSFLFALTLLIPLFVLNHPTVPPVQAGQQAQVSHHQINRSILSDTTGLPLLFSEDFEDEALGTLSTANWDYVYSWQVLADPLDAENQVLSTSNSDGHYVTARQGELDWQDQAVSMRFRWNGDTSKYYWGALGVRLNDAPSTGYHLSLYGAR